MVQSFFITVCSRASGDKLEELGYTDVTRYEEGIDAWRKVGYRLEGEAIKAAV